MKMFKVMVAGLILLLPLITNAQLKVWSNGTTIIGGTATLPWPAKLQVVGNTVYTATTSTITSAAYIRGNNGYSSATTPDYAWFNNDMTGFFHPSLNTIGVALGGTEYFRINTSGIQTEGNATFYQTVGSSTSSAMIRGLNAYSSATTPDYTWLGNDQTGFFHPAANTIGLALGGTEYMRFNSSGKLFLGTQTDYSSWVNIYAGNNRAIYCEVNHSVDWMQGIVTKMNRANGVTYVVNYAGADNFYVKGDGTACSAHAFYNWSDASLKENVTTIPNALDKVLGMRGVYYNFRKTEANNGDPNPREMGLIAQEVEQVAPEVVMTMADGKKAVAYGQLVGLLIEAMKDQNDSIRQLRSVLNQCCMASITNSTSVTGSFTNIDQAVASNPNKNYLLQNSPNPFNQNTLISYYIAPQGYDNAQIMVFDMQGVLKKTIPVLTSGKGSLSISASEFTPGMYLYSLVVNNSEVDTKRMILTK